MTRRARRNHTPTFKAKLALAAISPKRLRFGWGDNMLVELAQQFDVHPDQITARKAQLAEGAARIFGQERSEATPAGRFEGAARQDWGTDAGERFFVRRAQQGRSAERKAMIDGDHKLPVSRQARLLKLARSTVYYRPRPVSPEELALMRRLDELHLD